MRHANRSADSPIPSPMQWETYAFFVLCLVVVHLVLVWFLVPEILEGSLIGSDGYSRLVRVLKVRNGGGWYDSVIEDMNAPYGLSFHWTRPLDLMLLAGGWISAPFLGFERGLFWTGVILSPLFHICGCLGLAWAVAPIFDRDRRPLVCILLLAQPLFTSYGLAGRPDHHMLLTLVFILLLGFFFRSLHQPRSSRHALAAGGMAGFGIWVSIEFLAPLFVVFLALAILWLASFEGSTRRGLQFSLGLTAVLVVALISEHPPGSIFRPEFDRVSFAHLLIALVASGFWGVVTVGEQRAGPSRSVWWKVRLLMVGGIASFFGFQVVFPGVFSSPLAPSDPEFSALFLRWIEELQPLFPSALSEVGRAVAYVGAAVFALPFGILMLHPRHDDKNRAAWMTLVLCMGLFLPMVMHQIRFGIWTGIPLAVGAAGVLAGPFQRLDGGPSLFTRTVLRSALAILVITGPLFIGAIMVDRWENEEEPPDAPTSDLCAVPPLASALSSGSPGEEPMIIAADPDIGPEIVYRTDHLVVAGPYHRNRDGILDTYHMLASRDEAESRSLMADRSVDLVVICVAQSGFFQQVDKSDQTLISRLMSGREPSWLRPLNLPDSLPTGFLVFEVIDG